MAYPSSKNNTSNHLVVIIVDTTSLFATNQILFMNIVRKILSYVQSYQSIMPKYLALHHIRRLVLPLVTPSRKSSKSIC